MPQELRYTIWRHTAEDITLVSSYPTSEEADHVVAKLNKRITEEHKRFKAHYASGRDQAEFTVEGILQAVDETLGWADFLGRQPPVYSTSSVSYSTSDP